MNTITDSQIVTVESMPVMSWDQARVITTDLLAKFYGTETKHIQNNYLRNEGRFVSGKHFFKLTGSELKEFKNQPSLRGLVDKRASHLILWTERGAARHAKMLDTDEAWEVFERLEDCYFKVKAIVEAAAYSVNPADVLSKHQADILRDMLKTAVERLPKEKQAAAMISGWSKLKAHFGVTYRLIPQHEYAEAVSLVARHITTLEGEVLPPEPAIETVQLLDLDYPISRWLDDNPHLRDLQRGQPKDRLLVTHGDLFGPGSKSSIGSLLSTLKQYGYNVDGCVCELNSMRHFMETAYYRIHAIQEACLKDMTKAVRLTVQ